MKYAAWRWVGPWGRAVPAYHREYKAGHGSLILAVRRRRFPWPKSRVYVL